MRIAALALAAIALPGATQDEKVRLEVRAKKGDAFSHSATESNRGTLKATLGKNEQVREIDEKEVRKYREEVLEVEGVEPSRVRRAFSEWWKESKDGAGTVSRLVRGLHGRAIILKKAGDATRFEGAEEIPTVELARLRLRADPLMAGLPPEPMAPGREWTLDGAPFRQELEERNPDSPLDLKDVKAGGKFEKVAEHKGQKCAVVTVTVEAKGGFRGQKGLSVTYKISTTVHLAIATGRPLLVKGAGTGEFSGPVEQDGQALLLEGKFTMTMESENVYE